MLIIAYTRFLGSMLDYKKGDKTMTENKIDKRLIGSGLGTSNKTSPICIKFPPFMDSKLREMGDKSEYIRRAVAVSLQADGLLTNEEIEKAILIGLIEE